MSIGDYPARLTRTTLPPEAAGRSLAPAPQTDLAREFLNTLLAVDNDLQAIEAILSGNYRVPGSVDFVSGGAMVTVTAGEVNKLIYSMRVDEGQRGFVRHLGFRVLTNAYAASNQLANGVTWSLQINGTPHPKLDSKVFPADSLATPFDFSIDLKSGDLLEVYASNGNGSDVLVAVHVDGWTVPDRR